MLFWDFLLGEDIKQLLIVLHGLPLMVVCGIIPSTGIPLPFFSVGGSSIIVTLAMCGFVLNASRCEEKNSNNYVYEDVNLDTLTIL